MCVVRGSVISAMGEGYFIYGESGCVVSATMRTVMWILIFSPILWQSDDW